MAKQSKKSKVSSSKLKAWPKAFWKKNWIPGLLLFLGALALYFQTINFEYVLDDVIVHTENQYVTEGLSGLGKIFTTESFEGYFGVQRNLVAGGRYRPLSIASFAVENEFVGVNSRVSHILNAFFYGLMCLLLYRVLMLLFRKKKNQAWYLTIGFLASLLYMVHPLHTEVVANVKGRDEIFVFMGALAAMYAAIKYVYSNKLIWNILSGVFLFIGLLAKENAITFLGIIPLSLYFFTHASFKKIAINFMPLLVAAILYLILRYQAIGFVFSAGAPITDLMNNPFSGMNMAEKFATIFYTLGMYFKLMIFPHPLTHDYYPYHIPIMNWSDISSILSLLLYAGLGFLAIWGFKKKSVISYCILFYIMSISVVSNLLFPVGTFMNERFIFISSLAFCIALPYLLEKLFRLKFDIDKSRWISFALVALISILFLVKSAIRIPDWKNKFELNYSASLVSKNSARSNLFMGTAYFDLYQEASDKDMRTKWLDLASGHINKAVEIHPAYGNAIDMQAGVAAEKYKMDGDVNALLVSFENVLGRRPSSKYIKEYIEYLMDRQSVRNELLAFFPKAASTIVANRRDYANALHFLNYAYTMNPKDPDVSNEIAKLYQAQGNTQQANQFFNQAKQLQNDLN